MGSLPVVSGKEIRRALEKEGFSFKSQKGSHVKMVHADGRIVIVPMHREIALGTLRSIRRQSRLAEEEFLSLF